MSMKKDFIEPKRSNLSSLLNRRTFSLDEYNSNMEKAINDTTSSIPNILKLREKLIKKYINKDNQVN